MAKYDIVVVGAGNAGMSAALQCQLAGKRTLLIEQHNLPGGAATSFRRGRFEIEPSLHEICDCGPADNPGDVRTMMDAYGVKLDWMEIPDCYRVVSVYRDGGVMDVTMPSGVEAYIDALAGRAGGRLVRPVLFGELLTGAAQSNFGPLGPDGKVKSLYA